VGTALEPSTWESKLPVTQLVFHTRGAFPRSQPCVCALRGFLPGRVFPDRTTRRHGLARVPPILGGALWECCHKVGRRRLPSSTLERLGSHRILSYSALAAEESRRGRHSWVAAAAEHRATDECKRAYDW